MLSWVHGIGVVPNFRRPFLSGGLGFCRKHLLEQRGPQAGLGEGSERRHACPFLSLCLLSCCVDREAGDTFPPFEGLLNGAISPKPLAAQWALESHTGFAARLSPSTVCRRARLPPPGLSFLICKERTQRAAPAGRGGFREQLSPAPVPGHLVPGLVGAELSGEPSWQLTACLQAQTSCSFGNSLQENRGKAVGFFLPPISGDTEKASLPR